MSLSLKFSVNTLSPFSNEVTSNEVTFHQSSSIKIIPPDIIGIVDVTERLDEDFQSDDYRFKGRISLPNEPSPCEVVVKMVLGDDQAVYSQILQSYIQEAKFYQDHLCGNKSFYGNGVPRTYGCYETKLARKTEEHDVLVDCSCIVFQYYGSSKNLLWSTGAGISDFGLQAVELLLEMHKGGIRHGFISLDTNITCLDGKPFFTDFSQACKHNCPDKEFKLPIQLAHLDVDTLKCAELCDFLEELQDHVAPLRYHWYGYDVDYDQVDSLQSIFQHRRRPSFGRMASVEEQWEHAVKVWKFLCANWSSYHRGMAPPVGDTSFEAYKARYGLEIIYDDEKYDEYYYDSDSNE